MGLTRPTVAQLNTVVTEISDPVSVLNKGSTLANVDVGFVLNRDGGASPNVALYWNETLDSIVVAYTTSTGGVNSNIAVSSYANLTVGNITSSGNISAQYFVGNGAFLTGMSASSYGNVNVKAYTESMGFQNYGNVNVAAYTQSMGFQNYGNVNVAAYLPSGLASSLNTTGNILATTGVFNNVIVNTGNINAVGGYFVGSGQFLTGLPAGYSNVNVKAYTESMGFQNYGNTNVIAYTQTMGYTNYSNVNVAAYTQTQNYTNYSNVNTAAYTQTMGYTNYSNVNLAAYLGGAVSIGGNLTVQGKLDVANLSITVAKGAASSAAANGAGLTVDGAGATLLYTSATDTWNINKGLVVSSAGNVTINNTTVTTSTTTGALTVAGGVGVAGTIAVGGTLLAGNASGTPGQVLSSTGAGLAWVTAGGGNANEPFSLSSNDFGDLDGYTISEDEGDLSASTTRYDLQYIATLGPITASLLELPTYTSAALPSGQNAGALAYDTSVQTVKFNNGTVWANIAPTYYQIDDLGSGFDGITTSFAITYNDGTRIQPTNPNQLKIRIGGVEVSPFRYADDLVNLTEIAEFNRGFRIVSGNIAFASPPSWGMEFYGTVQANEEAEPAFVFKQTPFTALNIQYGY